MKLNDLTTEVFKRMFDKGWTCTWGYSSYKDLKENRHVCGILMAVND